MRTARGRDREGRRADKPRGQGLVEGEREASGSGSLPLKGQEVRKGLWEPPGGRVGLQVVSASWWPQRARGTPRVLAWCGAVPGDRLCGEWTPFTRRVCGPGARQHLRGASRQKGPPRGLTRSRP